MQDYETLQPWMRAFPSPEDVFASDVQTHAKHLQPVLSIDAAEVDPTWNGLFHFVIPREPVAGLLGEAGAEYYQSYCYLNFISFKREQDGRLRFLGDWRYFILGHKGGKRKSPLYVSSDYDELVKRYEDTELSLQKTKAHFDQHGMLNPWGQLDNPCAWIERVGGMAGNGNWTSGYHDEGFPIEEDDGDGPVGYGYFAHPLTYDGRRFRFVGELAGYGYINGAPDGVLMFYDPIDSIVLFSFDWT